MAGRDATTTSPPDLRTRRLGHAFEDMFTAGAGVITEDALGPMELSSGTEPHAITRM